MKKYIKYFLIASIFIAQNLFAQNATDTEAMDMTVYATWMGSAFLVMLFVMFGFFLFSASKEPANPENIVIQIPPVFVKAQVNVFAPGNSFYLLPNLSLELQRVRSLLLSALLIFSTILILLLIQK